MKQAAIALVVIAAVIYFIFFRGGPLKQDIDFQGATYGYAKHMYGGAIDNHFYTPDGIDFNKATSFIQILEFDDEIEKSSWPARLKPLLNRYQLRPVEDEELELAGQAQMSGFFYKSYAAPITVDDQQVMVIFITGSGEKQPEDSEYEVDATLDAIKSIRFE